MASSIILDQKYDQNDHMIINMVIAWSFLNHYDLKMTK